MITAQQAVDHLYHVAVTEKKATSTARLDTLAEYYESSQPTPEPFVDVPAASNDENQDNQLSFLDGVADAPVADTNAPDRLDASELPRARRVRVVRQGCHRVSQSP